MTQPAHVIQFPGRQDGDQTPSPDRPARSIQVEDGFTRIANELFEAIICAPLTDRERRVVLAIVRLTYGWNRKEGRITGGLLAKVTGLPATKASQTLAALVAKNVITRNGGSRSSVSLNKHVDQWKVSQTERKTPPPKQAKKAECDQIGPTDPKRYDSYQNGKSESYQNGNASKDMKDIPPLTSFEGEGDISKKPAKAKSNQLDISRLPSSVSADAVQGFIEHRKALKKPLTQRALNLNINEAIRAAETIPGLTADQALDETVLAGWQGVKADWLQKRLMQSARGGSSLSQAERLHAQNQEAIRQAVETYGTSQSQSDDYLNHGGHW